MRSAPPFLVDRFATAVRRVAITWFVFAAFLGVGGAPGAGHYAACAGGGITGENMWRWKIFGPVWDYAIASQPPPTDYYCHHPWGVFWIEALFIRVLGHRDLALCLPAALMSVATIVLLSHLTKNAWGTVASAAATATFSVIPIAVSFSNFNELEVMVIFGITLFLHGLERFLVTKSNRFLVSSLVGVVFATFGDWPGFILVGCVLTVSLSRIAILPKRLLPRVDIEGYARWWALSGTITAMSLGLWVGAFQKAGKLADWLGAAAGRSSGAEVPLRDVLVGRAFWIESAFTPLVIAFGKLVVPLLVLRFVLLRRETEFFALGTLVAATIQYVVFKQGADIHYFWPHYFALYAALAVAPFVATIEGIFGWVGRRLGRLQIARGFTFVLVLAPVVLLLPDAPRTLRYGRETGGRFNEHGNFIRDDLDMVHALRWIAPNISESQQMIFDSTSIAGWHTAWALGRMHYNAPLPPSLGPHMTPTPYWISRTSNMGLPSLQELRRRGAPMFIGDVVIIDLVRGPGPISGYRFASREPNVLERLVTHPFEPVLSIRSSEYVTWEWQIHLGDSPKPPEGEPNDLDEVRIAHNVAVFLKDGKRAQLLRERIERELPRDSHASYSESIELIGARVTKSVHPMIEAWFVAGGPLESNAYFDIRATVTAKKRWSLIPPDALERQCSGGPPLPSNVWRKGFIYATSCSAYHRIGVEQYTGSFRAREVKGQVPRRIDGPEPVLLAELP